MSANLIKQNITGGGTGDITLGSASSAAYHIVSDVMPVGAEFRGSFIDGNDTEFGVYKLSDSTTLERVHVEETLVAGVHNILNPSALDLSTSATFQIVADANGFIHAGGGLPYQNASGIIGEASFGMHDPFATNISLSHFRRMYPYFRKKSGHVSSASVVCTTAVAGALARIFAYQRKYDGSPGMMLGEFTLDGELDLSTTGIKTATLATPLLLDGVELFICIQASVAGALFKGNADAPQSWLGFRSNETPIGNLYRTSPYADAGNDETGSVWLEDASYITTILRDI